MPAVDLLIYGVLVLAFLLFNLVSQWLKHRRQRDDVAPAEPIPQGAGGLDAQWGRSPRPVFADTKRPAPRASAEEHVGRPGRPRVRQKPRLRTAEDLREAIVLTAILGPCRAQEPYGSREP